MLIIGLRRRRDFPLVAWENRVRTSDPTSLTVTPLRALRAKRFDLGGARVLHQSLVLGRFNSDQGDLAFGVVMNSPPVAVRQRRHAKVRVALAQELLAFFRTYNASDGDDLDGGTTVACSPSIQASGKNGAIVAVADAVQQVHLDLARPVFYAKARRSSKKLEQIISQIRRIDTQTHSRSSFRSALGGRSRIAFTREG